MGRAKLVLELVLIAIAFTLTLALLCEHFNVYIPAVVYLIPKDKRPSPTPIVPDFSSPVVKEEVVVIEPSPSPTLENKELESQSSP